MAALGRRGLVAAGLGAALVPGMAAALPIMNGWHEAVVIVPDLVPWIETLTAVGGWEVAARGGVNDSLNALWNLPTGAASEQLVMRNIGTTKGYIRLVRVMGAPQVQIRPDDQAWETGGINALDLRVVDIYATAQQLHARGWRAPSDPVPYKAYKVEVIQWTPESPDGVRLSFIQRLSPKLVGWGELKRWSRVANAAITTRDINAAQGFFGGTLGMKQISHTNAVGSAGPNVMGLPWALARSLPIDIRGFANIAAGEASIELISMPGAQGRDFSAGAHPPNWGIAALRVMVTDAKDAAARLGAGPVREVNVPPYGLCRVFGVTGTDGVRLEFYEKG